MSDKLNVKYAKHQLFAFWMCDRMLKSNIINTESFELFMNFMKIKDSIEDQNLLFEEFSSETKEYSKNIKSYISGKPEKSRNRKKSIVIEDTNPDLIRQVIGVANLDNMSDHDYSIDGVQEKISHNTTPVLPLDRIPIVENAPVKKPRARKVVSKPKLEPVLVDLEVKLSSVDIAADTAADIAADTAADTAADIGIIVTETISLIKTNMDESKINNTIELENIDKKPVKKPRAKKIISKPTLVDMALVVTADAADTTILHQPIIDASNINNMIELENIDKKPVKKPRVKKIISKPDVVNATTPENIHPSPITTSPVKKPRTKTIVASPTPLPIIDTQICITDPESSSINNTKHNSIDTSMNELDFEVVSDRIENIEDYNNNVKIVSIDGKDFLIHENGSIYDSVTHQFVGQRINGRVIFTNN